MINTFILCQTVRIHLAIITCPTAKIKALFPHNTLYNHQSCQTASNKEYKSIFCSALA